MCGIAGIVANRETDLESVLRKMTDDLRHRGPDRSDLWIDSHSGVALGHSRLAVLDLSESGNQPMTSHSGRFIIVFNGEIYNHKAIKNLLEKQIRISWRGTSDTEIILAAFELFGIEQCVALLNGMFAFALYDRRDQTLFLGRDRMGEKPLYYGHVDQCFAFASTVRPFKRLPGFSGNISQTALKVFMETGSVAAPLSIYDGIYKLQPGKVLSFNLHSREISEHTFYDVKEEYIEGQKHLFSGSRSEATYQLETLLKRAVNLQMHGTDVPIGAFLSGGVDSSLIVALMQSQQISPVNTFTIGFEEKEFNEAPYAREVAKHLKVNHHEMIVSGQDALDVVPLIPEIYDEPFSDSSLIPTFLLAKLTREKVTVSLTGDAGDELFGGYSRYALANKVWTQLSAIPHPVRQVSETLIRHLPTSFWQQIFRLKALSDEKNQYHYADKFLKASELLRYKTRDDFYFNGFLKHNRNAPQWLTAKDINSFEYFSKKKPSVFPSFFDDMMLLDQMTYLPNNNLTKVDRAAMAVSLETRTPFLDAEVVKFAHSLPIDFKIRNGIPKWILKEILYKYVPKTLIERPKKGFSVPLALWLRGPLHDWAENLLDHRKLMEQGIFNADFVSQKWREHLSAKRNWQNLLWDVLIFQNWLEKNK